MKNMNRNTWKVVALMSGTSLDGLDLAYIHFSRDKVWTYTMEHAQTIAYTSSWQEKLKFRKNIPAKELEQLDEDYGHLLAKYVQEFILTHNIQLSKIDFISSHGHTLFHEPNKGITKQIGNGPQLKNLTGIKVVCDFRIQDVQLGGQGAPLVPIGDLLLYSNYDACLNLGGFANISYHDNDERCALDICPVNFVMNTLANELGLPYDNNGDIAKSGSIIQPLLLALNSLSYYKEIAPKTLGAEWVAKNIEPLINERIYPTKDYLHTFSKHCSFQIAQVLNQHNLREVLVTGGGAYNKFLISLIQDLTKTKIIIPSPNEVEFKEALIFGLMGVLKVLGEINVLQSVTGADRDHSSGKIYT